MIYEREILKGKECPEEYRENLLELLVRGNKVRDAYGFPMFITSGFRTLLEHLEIYRKKGITDKSKIPMASHHLYCRAFDVADSDGRLMKWCKKNETLLREIGVWIEEGTVGWVHFQIVPFASYKPGGAIFFKP